MFYVFKYICAANVIISFADMAMPIHSDNATCGTLYSLYSVRYLLVVYVENTWRLCRVLRCQFMFV